MTEANVQKWKRIPAIASVLTALIILIYTCIYTNKMMLWMVHGSYYVMLVLFALWMQQLKRYLESIGFSARQFLQTYYAGIVFATVLSALIVISERPSFKVLSDETNILAVSKSMCFQKTIYNATMGVHYFGNFNSLFAEIDKRPFIFPFLLSVLHSVIGYSPNNAFIFNFIVMVLLLSMVFICTQKVMGSSLAYSAVIFTAACPLFAICGTSGGPDLLNILLIGVVFLSLYGFMGNPSSPKLSFLWMTLCMLANCREESVFYFAAVIAFLFIFRYLRDDVVVGAVPVMSLSSLLMLPLFWQRILLRHDSEVPKGDALFSFMHFKTHLIEAAKAQLDFSYFPPYPTLLHLIGFGVMAYLLINIFLLKRIFQTKYQKQFVAILISCLLIYLVIILACFWQHIYTHPASARLFLLFSLLCALSPIVFMAACPLLHGKSPQPLLVFSILSFLLYHPAAEAEVFSNSFILKRETDFAYGIMKTQPDKDVIIITGRPGQITVFDYGAVDYAYAHGHKDTLKLWLDRHLIRDIIVIQRISYRTLQPLPEDLLDPFFILETVCEKQTSAESFVRISKVVKFQEINKLPITRALQG